MDHVSSMLHYGHDISNIYTTNIGLNLEINTKNQKSPEDNIDNRDDYQWSTMKYEEEEDYSYLILSPNHFEKSKNNKGKNIIQDDNYDASINQHLTLIINEAFKLQSNCII